MTSRCRCWLPTWRPHLNFREVRGHHPRPPQRSDHWECLCWEVWVFSNSTLGKVVHSQMVLGYFAIETWDFPPCSFLEATGTENLHYKLFLGACTRWNDIPKIGQTQTDMLNQTPRCGSCVCLKIVYSISIHIPIWSTDESPFSLLRLQVWGRHPFLDKPISSFDANRVSRCTPSLRVVGDLPWCDIHIQYDEVYNIIKCTCMLCYYIISYQVSPASPQ